MTARCALIGAGGGFRKSRLPSGVLATIILSKGFYIGVPLFAEVPSCCLAMAIAGHEFELGVASVVYDKPIGPRVRGEEEDNGDCAHGEGYVDGNVSHSFACLLVCCLWLDDVDDDGDDDDAECTHGKDEHDWVSGDVDDDGK